MNNRISNGGTDLVLKENRIMKKPAEAQPSFQAAAQQFSKLWAQAFNKKD